MRIQQFEEIEAWKMGRRLSVLVYSVSGQGDFARDFGLRDQIRRAAGSVMHNIAEGFDAESNREFVRFLGYSKRSCTEVQSQLYVALDQKYLTQDKFDQMYSLARQTRGKIKAFMNYLVNFEKHKS